MPAYKNKESGKWYVVTQYTDWTGARKQKCKRGFDTRREALEWEQKFQQQSAGDLDMSFEAFVEIYTTDLKARLKESTWQTKEHIIQTKIVPYFGKRKINEITTKDVIAWQNELLAYRIWEALCQQYPDRWSLPDTVADYLAWDGKYDVSVQWHRKALAVGKPPRYVDPIVSIAQILEIQGDHAGAIAAREEELEMYKTEWGFTEGETADAVRRDIARLKAHL